MNPNTFAGIKETWDDVYQVTHHKIPVFPIVSNYRLAAGLKRGDTVHREYPSTLVANVMSADGSFTRQALVDTDETLVIDKEYDASFYIKELDTIQNHLSTRIEYANQAMAALWKQIDGDVLGLYASFTETVDDGDLGGTDGNGITLTTSNVKKMFFRARAKLQKQNILIDQLAAFNGFKRPGQDKMGVALISPEVHQLLLEAVDGKDTVFGDKASMNGHAGMFAGFNLFVSNALAWSAQLELPTIPTAGDTITINGVVLTAAADGAATNAGDFSIQATVDLAAASLVQLINGTGTAGADNYIELSAANRLLLKNITATYDSGTNMLTLVAKGKGNVVVSETLTPAGDIWTPAKQIQHCLFGVEKAIDVVIQKQPSMKTQDRDGKVGVDVITWTACGYKVFNEGKARMLDVQVRTDGDPFQ